jgi:hypothetical protein
MGTVIRIWPGLSTEVAATRLSSVVDGTDNLFTDAAAIRGKLEKMTLALEGMVRLLHEQQTR